MNLEAIWQTHKKFIIQVISGAAVFLILMWVRSAIADSATRTAKSNASQEMAFMNKTAELAGAEGREKGRAKSLEEKLEPAVAQALMWNTADGFTLPEGEASPAIFYASALSKASSDIGRRADRWNAQIPRRTSELGLQDEIEDSLVEDALARVDLVRGVVLKLLDAGVREISFVEPGEGQYTARQGDGRFLREVGIRVSFLGDTKLLAKVLEAFQKEGSFLQVRGCRVTRETKKPGSKLVIELDLQSLSIVSSAPGGASNSTTATTPSGGPSSFVRDR